MNNSRKAMTNLDSILKSRDITLLTKVRLVKAMVFPVVMYGCESWTIKKAEGQRTDAFELWSWRRLWESSLDSKEIQPVHPKGDQSWVFIGRTDAESERINTCVYFPIYVVTQYWAEFSVLYSRSLLVSHFKYSSVYMSIPNSLTVPSPNLPLC